MTRTKTSEKPAGPVESPMAYASRQESAARLHGLADTARRAGHHAPAAGLAHLADLYAHSPMRYRDMPISGGHESGVLAMRAARTLTLPAGSVAADCAALGEVSTVRERRRAHARRGRPRTTRGCGAT